MLKRYWLTGAINTLLHTLLFFLFTYLIDLSVPLANLLAFLVSSTFAYLLHAKIVFKAKIRFKKYFFHIFIYLFISYGVGCIVKESNWHPMLTVPLSVIVNLTVGYLVSKKIAGI
jgi:putative flippase GtrA